MHYDEEIYRPPMEARTPLLQVTSGCSHNACTFCGMYKKTPYKVSPFEEIEEDLKEIQTKRPDSERIYLLNGDPFSMDYERLKTICLIIRKYLPAIKTIAMYASVNNIADKTDEELRSLQSLGINMLYVGIETGHADILKRINKGNTPEEAVRELKRIEDAGIYWKAMIMLGIAGSGMAEENAEKTAELFSKVSPRGIFCMSYTMVPDSVMYNQWQKGKFREASEYERIMETKILLENINPPKKVRFNSVHVSNTLTIDGFLPEDRERMIRECDEILGEYTEEEFQKTFDRHNLRNL